MISIVCVYNDEKILNDFLLKSLKAQTVEYELIKIDNTQNRFKSAAEALNYGGKKAKGEYIMLVHQDVDLSSDTWLKNEENGFLVSPGDAQQLAQKMELFVKNPSLVAKMQRQIKP